MDITKSFLVFSFLMAGLCACAGNSRQVVADGHLLDTGSKFGQAKQSLALAMEYYEQEGYEKSADLFLDAARLFKEAGSHDGEKNALIAAAKMQLKCSQKESFLLTMARYQSVMEPLSMPSEEECFLINLSDSMKRDDPSYPVSESCRFLFNY